MATKPFLSQIAVPVGTTTGDVYYPQTSLLMHFNGTNGSTTMTDNSKNNAAVTAVGNAQVTTTDPKFGTGAMLLDGTGDCARASASADFNFGTGNFTIEFFARWTNLVGPSGLHFLWDTGIVGTALRFQDTNNFLLYFLVHGPSVL